MWEAIKEIFGFFSEILKSVNRKAGDSVIVVSEIYDNMRNIVLNKGFGISRFLIIKAHNCGGNVKPGELTKVSVIHEEVQSPMVSVKSDYQELDVDGRYNDMLAFIRRNGMIEVVTDNLEVSLLKDIYQKEGVKKARIFYLKDTKKGLWFASVATHNETVNFGDPALSLALRIAVSNIKKRI